MIPRFRKRRIPASVMDRLRMATAVAAEQALEEHVRSAVELVEQGADRAPVHRLLSAYVRLHHLGARESHKLHEGVLAMLGRRPDGPGPLDGPRSPLARLRRRLRGRVNPELRDWIERHTAAVELAVLDLHVESALKVLRLLEDHLPAAEGISLYCETLSLRPVVAEMVRLKVLKALQDQATGQVEPLSPDRSVLRPFRKVENDG